MDRAAIKAAVVERFGEYNEATLRRYAFDPGITNGQRVDALTLLEEVVERFDERHARYLASLTKANAHCTHKWWVELTTNEARLIETVGVSAGRVDDRLIPRGKSPLGERLMEDVAQVRKLLHNDFGVESSVVVWHVVGALLMRTTTFERPVKGELKGPFKRVVEPSARRDPRSVVLHTSEGAWRVRVLSCDPDLSKNQAATRVLDEQVRYAPFFLPSETQFSIGAFRQ